MKKIMALTMVMLLLCTLAMSSPVSAKGTPKSTVIDVYEGQDITDAVNSANAGDIVFVHKGVYPGVIKEINGTKYNQAIWISGKTNITVKGEEGTILDGANSSPIGIRVTPSTDGLTFTSGVTIEGFEIRNFVYGIYLLKANNNQLDNNTISNVQGGMYLVASNDNDISKNTVSNTVQPCIAIGNSATGNLSNRNVIEKNDIDSNSIGISIWGNDNQVLQNNVTTLYDGIGLGADAVNSTYSTHNLIKQNQITSTGDTNSAINLNGAHSNDVIQNAIKNSHIGISLLAGASDNEISKNTIRQSAWWGIAVIPGASRNSIEKNEVSGSGYFDLYTSAPPTDNIWVKNDYKTKNW